MNRPLRTLALSLVLLAATLPGLAAEPDYAAWTGLLETYYSPQNGMDYQGLRKNDLATLTKLAGDLSKVDVGALARNEQLAFWINLYNISTVKLICDNYPTKSIRDLSTDPIVRLNVFKKEIVPQGGKMMSLNDVENIKIREGFKDPRIHFAINCAAKSCPPMRREAFTGARVNEQLDDQARVFFAGPGGAKITRSGSKATLTVTKVMDWFDDDFDDWGGGVVAFTKKFLAPDKRAQLDGAKVSLSYYEYNWDLNDWKR
ncbi:MAG: DUF547 domain-containing protein [Acidobacteria bacterium]|nr:DUF547 domain-containing protein [Acidobacteriota bacterium]